MTTIVSMLRGINVGGNKRLKMSVLAEMYTKLGFSDVKTYIQSGNVVCDVAASGLVSAGGRVEKELKTRFRLSVVVINRTASELRKVIDRNPFVRNDPSRLHVTFLQRKPGQILTTRINDVKAKEEKFSVIEREVFLFLPNGMGRTKLQNGFFEKELGVSATTRNWNTVTTLSEMANRIS